MRWTTLVTGTVLSLLVGCNDLRDYRGRWHGERVGDAPALLVGAGERATLTLDAIDTHGVRGALAVDGLFAEQPFESLPGAEADALSNMTFAGSPLRVYLAFVPIPDAAGDALALIALYDDRRIEVRLLRGGRIPLYAIFALEDTP